MRARLSATRAAVRRMWATWQRWRGLRRHMVIVNESIIYERALWARDEEDALQAACRLLARRRARGWLEVGRHFRQLRTRRP